MEIKEFEKTVKKFIGSDNKPVVVYAALWPFMRVFNSPLQEIPQLVLDSLVKIVGADRSLLMPTFSSGYKNGICNLDEEKSETGFLSELFRKYPDTQRTLSAFFSFNVLGPDTNNVVSFKPKDAWGDGSLYEWMEEQNVHFLMLGVHPTNCSYLHRMEWLIRDKINYRYVKHFSGVIIRSGKRIHTEENLFVRSLDPLVINDFSVILDDLKNGGMSVIKLDGVYMAHMRAQNMKNTFLKLLQNDPLLTVENREMFERKVKSHG